MVRRIEWMRIPREDFDKLHNAFYCHEHRCEKDYGAELIDLAERYKSYAVDHDGRRYVFVFVRDMDDVRVGLAGFVVYDKSSKVVLLSRYTSFYRRYGDKELDYYRLMLRLAMDNRLDVFEYLLRMGYIDTNPLLTFFGLCYKYLGDEFIDYLYRNYRDIPDRFNRNKLIYGRNFVFIPKIKVGDYDGESVGLIRAGDGSIILFRSYRSPVIVREDKYWFHRLLSYLIDYAEDLEKNLVVYEDWCNQYWCNYIVFSSASPPHWWRSSAVVLMSRLDKYSSGSEELRDMRILFIDCGNYCSIYSLGEVADYLTSKRGEYREYLMEDLFSLYEYDHYFPRFIEYVIAHRDRFPMRFVEEAYKHYLHSNVMNVSS